MTSQFPTDGELLNRVKLREDNFVERKVSLNRLDEARASVVAFANTVRAPLYGVVFIGLNDDGTPSGNLDSGNQSEAANTVAKKLNGCCPTLQYLIRWLKYEGHEVLAIFVPESTNGPHFIGPAFVRKGSRNLKACDETLDTLVADRLSVARELRKWLNKTISTAVPVASGGYWREYSREGDCTLVEVTPHWVRWKNLSSRSYHSCPIGRIELDWDEDKGRICVLAQAANSHAVVGANLVPKSSDSP